MDENKEIIELVDENGETVCFQLLAGIEYENEQYIVVTDDLDDEGEGESDVYIMLVREGEDDTATYEPVEEEAVQDAVFAKFMKLIAEEDGADE